MGQQAHISYCDSSLNLQMGCRGCELWNPKIHTCYAGTMTAQYAGKNAGWPISFDQPKIFPERMETAMKWSDLTGTLRINKPHLNGMPRVIFLDDMGDTFTPGLDPFWLDPYVPQLEVTAHLYLMFTKQYIRARAYWEHYGRVPDNVWMGVSVTSQDYLHRIKTLCEIPARTRILSIEPMLEAMDIRQWLSKINWVIAGFESGVFCRPGNENWMRSLRSQCGEAGVPFYVKQMGGATDKRSMLKDIPEDLRIREVPGWEHLQWKGKTSPAVFKPQQASLF